MMKKKGLTVILGVMVLLGGIATSVGAAPASYGAAGVANLTDAELTVPVILTFALQDEYLARGEYQVIMEFMI